MLTTRKWVVALFFLFQSLLSADQVGVEFPDGYSIAPYKNTYRFDRFDFHPQDTYKVNGAEVTFPDRVPFIILKQFFLTLATSDAAACSVYFSDWTPDIQNGLGSLKNMPPLEVVADWKQDGHWVVIMSKGGERGKSMLPFVMKADESQKFITDARFLGDFIGALGKFLVDNPNGAVTVVEYKSEPAAAPPGTKREGASLDNISTSTYLIASTLFALFLLLVIYVVKFRK